MHCPLRRDGLGFGYSFSHNGGPHLSLRRTLPKRRNANGRRTRDPPLFYTATSSCAPMCGPTVIRAAAAWPARGSGGGFDKLRGYMREKARAAGVENIRPNAAGCLDRCEFGPNMVIYPEGVWYHYETTEDIDEIVQKHLVEGGRVDRLMLQPDQKPPAH